MLQKIQAFVHRFVLPTSTVVLHMATFVGLFTILNDYAEVRTSYSVMFLGFASWYLCCITKRACN